MSQNKVFALRAVDGSDGKTAPIAVNATATKYSQAFKIGQGTNFSVDYKLASSGVPSVTIQLEECRGDGELLTITEGASDTNFIIPESLADIVTSLADKIWHKKAITPVTGTMARFKITGISGNPSDTTVDIYFNQQEQL